MKLFIATVRIGVIAENRQEAQRDIQSKLVGTKSKIKHVKEIYVNSN